MTTTGNRHGQALLELAVFGMVAMAALGFLIRVGMQMNFDQEVRMAAFRRALAAAAAASGGTNPDPIAVSYYYANDRQMPNPTDGYMSLSRGRSEASAFVEWGDRLSFAYQDASHPASDAGRQTQQKIIVRVDDTEHTFHQPDFPRTDPAAPPGILGFQGIVNGSDMTNASHATISQSAAGASLSSNSGTTSTVYVNTEAGAPGGTPVSSSVGGSASWSP